ncbi:MAG: transglycosylase domain-containing protein [Hyphomicrobiaceae bacterium]
MRLAETTLALPIRLGRFLLFSVLFNPRLGPLRHVVSLAVIYAIFAVFLVYAFAPIRAVTGQIWMADKLRYDAERWLATALYDASGNFVGTFDARLDSQRDVNFTGLPIEVDGYTANPDHKSIPVRSVPLHYWRCLVYHEDRYMGGWLNPFGIDLVGVLKIPYSTVRRSFKARRLVLGIGGSTLPMQFVRVIYKTPPDPREGAFGKLARKLTEWWLAPIVYHELTRGGDKTQLKQWAANHLWLAQRTGGSPLHGVEVTSRVVFGKPANELTIAEQFVLASAVNKPIILMPGSDRLNKVRLDRWRYIAEVRARKCADVLLAGTAEQKKVLFELVSLAGGPPDPKLKAKLQQALERHAPRLAKRAEANPEIRANILVPAVRLGVREEMKHDYGFGWRRHVRGVTLTLDVTENMELRRKLLTALGTISTRFEAKVSPGYTLDPAKAGSGRDGRRLPNVIVVAANARGEIVRYFEIGDTSPYFGSVTARDDKTGRYRPEREARAIASTAKIMAAIAIANDGRDTPQSLYVDSEAPASGLEGCGRNGALRRGRKAIVSFACSLNRPLEWRTVQLGQPRLRHLIERFGFTPPPGDADGHQTPASTAIVRGLVAGSPRRVHQMAGVVLGALTGRGGQAVPLPTLIRRYDYIRAENRMTVARDPSSEIVPNRIIRATARPLLRTLLEAPLCYAHAGVRHGTLKTLGDWCSSRRTGVSLHFAKTGTHVTADPDATVDAWIAGGIQFSGGAAYSYVVVVGTGSSRHPWAHKLHSSQVAQPLLAVLLADLETLARRSATAAGPATRPGKIAQSATGTPKAKPRTLADDEARRRQIFQH